MGHITYAQEQLSAKTTSFSLEILERNILICIYAVHDAFEDCKHLKKIIEHSRICIHEYHLKNSFINYYIISITKQIENTKFNKQLLMPLTPGKSCFGWYFEKKISSSGLSIHNLQLLNQRKGFEEIYGLITECFHVK